MKKRMNIILFLIILALEFVVFVFGVLCASAGMESIGFGFVLLSYALMVCSYLMIKKNTLCNSVTKIGLCFISLVWILGALLNAIDFTICCLIMIGEAITCYLLSKVLTKLTLKESINEIKQLFTEIAKSKASNATDTMKDLSAKTSKAVKENVIPTVEHAKQKTDDLNEAVSKDIETAKKGIKDLSIKASNSIKEHADASKNSLKEKYENSKNQLGKKRLSFDNNKSDEEVSTVDGMKQEEHVRNLPEPSDSVEIIDESPNNSTDIQQDSQSALTENDYLPFGNIDELPFKRYVNAKDAVQLSKDAINLGVQIYADNQIKDYVPSKPNCYLTKQFFNLELRNTSYMYMTEFSSRVGKTINFAFENNDSTEAVFGVYNLRRLGNPTSKEVSDLIAHWLKEDKEYYAYISKVDTISDKIYFDIGFYDDVGVPETTSDTYDNIEEFRNLISYKYPNFLNYGFLDDGPFPIFEKMHPYIDKFVPKPHTIIRVPVVGMQYREDFEECLTETDDWTYFDKDFVVYGERIFRYRFEFYTIELVPEPTNPHDPNAIKVIGDGIHIGYILKEDCRKVHNYMKNNHTIMLGLTGWGGPFKYVDDFDKVHRGKKNFGCELYFVNLDR